jgi:hypothetical protein
MNVRIAHLFAFAALALPLSQGVLAEETIRSRDIVVAPYGQADAVPTASQATRVIHSREIAAPTEYLRNGDIEPSRVTFSKVVRSPSEFGFGQGGPEFAARSQKATRIATRQGGTEGSQSN